MTSQGCDAETNYERDFNYRRLYLPQLPRIVKNRGLDRYRHSLRTTSEEYGHFWTCAPSNNNTPLPSISAPDNHNTQQPGTERSKSDEAQMTSNTSCVVMDEDGILSRPLLEGSHRSKSRRDDQLQTNDNGDDEDDDVAPFKTRGYDKSDRGRMYISSFASPRSRWGFRVAIDYAPPPLGVATDRLGFSTVSDVIRVDLKMHLRGGVVTLRDVPYSFVKTQQ